MSEDQDHSLRIRCPTWDHLENFYERKIKDDNVLLARVPFAPQIGATLTLALELPDGVVVDIEAEVAGVRQAPDGRKSAIRMLLADMDTLVVRLRRAVASGRNGFARGLPLAHVPALAPRTDAGLPVPIPADVPIDELVPPLVLPAIDDVDAPFRERYRELHLELSALREKAAHEVLGVAWDAEVFEIRRAYFKLVKIYHPDVAARHGSDAIVDLAAEIFIYVNLAYDRLRDSAVAAGKAIVAGPALLPHRGWIANFDDIGTVKPRRPLRSDDMSGPVRMAPNDNDRDVAPGVSGNASDGAIVTHTSSELSVPLSASKTIGDDGSTALPQRLIDAKVRPASASHLAPVNLFDDARITERGMTPLGSDDAAIEPHANAAILRERGEELLKSADYEAARNRFAEVLEQEPRNRQVRALYHVAYGHTLLARDKSAEAMTQFEVALKHDPECEYAKLAKMPPRARARRPSFLQRLFRK